MGKRIEICAPIGVGKTTLAKALSLHGFAPLYERFEDNPNLLEFYETFSPESSVKKDEWFLNEQRNQAKKVKYSTKPVVMDYSLLTSQAFVDVGANTPENKAYLQHEWEKAIDEVGHPDLIIALKLDTQEQARRIQERSREGEEDIPSDYLHSLKTAIDKRLGELPASVPVLEVDAAIDFKNPQEVKKIAKEIHRLIDQQIERSR